MVSHCATPSKREVVVNRLKSITNLTVDIFGGCGDQEHRLPPETSVGVDATLEARVDLYINTLKNFKFYLSFENSLCQDYITEKFFLAVNAGILPVVYGGLSKANYEEAAPPNSYINVEDFKSIEDLNDFLVHLANNQTAYTSYFWWKEDYKVETIRESHFRAFCDMCQLLNDYHEGIADEDKHWTTLYRDFQNYWNPQGICRQPDDKYL